MMGYATTTGTNKNISALRDAGWRLILTPDINQDHGMRYAIDNGAYGCYLRQQPFDAPRFRRLLHSKGRGADWVVIPDIVAAGHESLRFSLEWLPECQRWCKLSLLAVQDGMTPDDIINYIGPDIGIFVGGTTEWKLETMPLWGDVASLFGCYLHVGRVNTRRRINYCESIGADSFDGTSVTKYSSTLPLLDSARRQMGFIWQ